MRPIEELLSTAAEARAKAYAPYSGYAVGVALESAAGRIFTGCNVENVSYPVTICAERTAIVKMISEGDRVIAQLALVTQDGGLPCGMCLQAMREFTQDPSALQVHVGDSNGYRFTKTLAELLPYAFQSSDVNRTER